MKIAIIGAGPAGLCTAKEIIESGGNHNVTVFEASDKVGGVFAEAYRGLRLVNNNLLISFSDFLDDPDERPIKMWKASEYVDYLYRYAKHFNVLPHIKFSHRVVGVKKLQKKWRVTVDKDGETHSYKFDYVVVCSGLNQNPNIPKLPNQHKFKGKILHANEVKDYEAFKNKRVLVIGMGEYASDLTYFIAQQAKSVAVSIRRWPGYIIPRYQDGQPTDFDTSRLYHSLPKHLHRTLLGKLLKIKRRVEYGKIKDQLDKRVQEVANQFNSQIDEISVFERFSNKSELFPKAIIDFDVAVKPRVFNLKRNGVDFEDGSEYECDYIIHCTGFQPAFPFLPAAIQEEVKNMRRLYKYTLPLTIDNMAFVGFVRPGVGSIPPAAEMQARYLALVLNNQLSLPSKQDMIAEVRQQEVRDLKQFPLDAGRVKNLTDYLTFLSNMAQTIQCEPKGWRLFLSNPVIWYKVYCAFLCPAQFRLVGPGAKPEEAKRIIKKLPLMPISIIGIEFITVGLCKLLSFLGLKRFTTVTQQKAHQ